MDHSTDNTWSFEIIKVDLLLPNISIQMPENVQIKCKFKGPLRHVGSVNCTLINAYFFDLRRINEYNNKVTMMRLY